MSHGMARSHAFEDVFKIGKGLDTVEFRGGDERADPGPAVAPAVRTGEQMVFAAKRNGPDGALDRIVIELDAAIVEEPAEGRPADEGNRAIRSLRSPPQGRAKIAPTRDDVCCARNGRLRNSLLSICKSLLG